MCVPRTRCLPGWPSVTCKVCRSFSADIKVCRGQSCPMTLSRLVISCVPCRSAGSVLLSQGLRPNSAQSVSRRGSSSCSRPLRTGLQLSIACQDSGRLWWWQPGCGDGVPAVQALLLGGLSPSGDVGRADRSNPFGACDSDEDCWAWLPGCFYSSAAWLRCRVVQPHKNAQRAARAC